MIPKQRDDVGIVPYDVDGRARAVGDDGNRPANDGRIAIRPYRGLRSTHRPNRNLVGDDAHIVPFCGAS